MLGLAYLAHGGEIHCADQNADWCSILDGGNLTDGDTIAIENADHAPKVMHFVWRTANNVKTIPNIILSKFPVLDTLDLQIGLESLSPPDFEHADKVTTLALVKNKLRSVPSSAFVNAKKLQIIQLDGNQIEHIEDYAFKGLNRLTTITLNYNVLTNIGRFAFAGAKNLDEIELNNNDIHTIEAGAFDLPKLEKLTLASNMLTTLPNGLFDHAPLLTEFAINDNALNTVPEAFFGNNVIDNLNLAWNPLHKAQIEDFTKIPKLQVLDLQVTGIIWPEVTKDWSKPSASPLIDLNLSFNTLKNSDVLKMVSVFGNLEKLTLSYTKITAINNMSDTKRRFTNMTEVSVDGAEMDCDWMQTATEFFKELEVELVTGADTYDFNEKKRERVNDAPCGKYFNVDA